MRIGIDLGGTKIAGIAMDEHGEVMAYERIPASSQDYEATISKIIGLIATLEQKTGRQGSIGIGTPGAISPTSGLMRNSNSACLNQRRFDRDLGEALGRDFRLANDADCFALSEAKDGAGRDAATVFGVIIGTGVGGGLVFNGQLITGPNAVAGEWGHNPLPWATDDERPGDPCYCGKSGCVETFLSGPGMQRQYAKLTGKEISPIDIVKQAGTDESAHIALNEYVDRLARALSVIINIIDPEVIVLGGGMSNIEALYERVPQRWGDYVFSDGVRTRLVKHYHGDDSGVRGAAWLWSEK